jgi:predicted Zn finger-like uncharacterized protein
MKVTCQSCQAKYTIADEKVRGKVAKIRCKKCGTTIIVDGNDPATASVADAPASAPVADYTQQGASDEPWTVLVADGDQRNLTAAQVAELFAGGTVGYETLVWKDGMADWTAIAQIDALRSVLENGPRPTMTPLEQAASMPSSAPPPAAFPEAPSSRPAPTMAARGRAAEPAAARRPGRGGSTDLFGAATQEDVLTSAAAGGGAPHADGGADKLTGARNENSVLFSLSALTGGPGPSTGAAPERDPASNKADLRALMGGGGGAPAKSKIDDIMNLSGGGVYSPGLLAAPALAPPPIDMMSAASPADSGGSKSKSLMMAIGGGVLVIGAVAIAFTTMSSKADSTDKASAGASAAGETNGPLARVGNPSNAPSEGPTEPAGATREPMRQGEAVKAEAPSGETAPAAVAPGSPVPKAEGEKTEKVERKTATAPKAEKPPAAAPPAGLPPPPVAAPAPAPAPAPAAPAAGGSGDFDRAAALSALSAAATAAQACKKPDGPTGSGRIAVTFANNGSATTANVEGPPFAGTPVGGCVAARFRSVHIPPFGGSVITVRKTFIIN